MIDFPSSTKTQRRIPKEAFYKHLTLTKALKNKFISDVEKITALYSLTKENLNLSEDADIKEILLLEVDLKRKDYDAKILEEVAGQNQHSLIFLLVFEGSGSLALYRGKLYRTKWTDLSDVELKPRGFSLDEIWDSFTEQIALYEERALNVQNLSLDERLSLQDEIIKAEKLIEKTEAAAWKEVQPKKRFEVYSRLSEYKKHLEELKEGNNFVK